MRTPPTQLKQDKTTGRAFARWQGKKVYFGKWDTPEASKAFGAWLAGLHATPTAPDLSQNLTVLQCVEQYLYHAESYYSKDGKTTQEYRNVCAAMQTLVWHAGGPKDLARDFGPRKLIALQKAMATETVSETVSTLRYARNTINSRIGKIRRCFRWCAAQELIPAEIVTALEMVDGVPEGRGMARESPEVGLVAIATVIATLPHLSPTVATMVQVQLLCGMRPQDVCGMTWGQVDRTGEVWLYRPLRHKMQHKRQSLVKAVPVAAQRLLTPLLREGRDELIFSPVDASEFWRSQERKPRTVPKVRECARGPYATSAYGRAVVYGIARANKSGKTVPHWTPNQLRHAIASQLRGTSGIEAAQVFLGHAKPDATLIYAEQSEARLIEIARALVSPLPSQPPSTKTD